MKRRNTPGADIIKRTVAPLEFYRCQLLNTPLKKNGWNDGGLCPFHADKTTGSFHVNTENGAFKCFSCDVKGGDIIAFIMALHGINFYQALEKLSDDWGII